MNIILVSKLSDLMLETFLQPLLKLEKVEKIYVIRDTISTIKYKKVIFINNFPFKKYNKLGHIGKIIKGIILCKNKKIDLIVGILIYPHGYIANIISFFTRKPFIHITIAGHREFWIFGKFVEKINLLLFKRALFVTSTGENTYSYFIRKGYNPQKVIKLPNIIDMKNFFDKEAVRKFDIVSLSRLDKNKNVSLLIKSVSKLKEKHNPRVLIAGIGSEYDNLKQEAKLLCVENNIRFSGWIEQSKIINVYNSSKIYVLCSKGEGFPLTVLEAMACGCVPIVTNVGDISDVVKHGINGFIIYDSNNVDELTAILESLINDEEKIREISFRAKKIRKELSINNIASIWDKIL